MSVAVATVAILWRRPMVWIIRAPVIFTWLAFPGLPIWPAAIGDDAQTRSRRPSGHVGTEGREGGCGDHDLPLAPVVIDLRRAR